MHSALTPTVVVLSLGAVEVSVACTHQTEPDVACVPAGGDLGGGKPVPGSVPAQCCPGLQMRFGRVLGTDVPPSLNPQGDECFAEIFTPYFCVACGDGICGAGENFCRCPEDCSRPDASADAGFGPEGGTDAASADGGG